MTSFIEVYDNALTGEECKILISQFEKSQNKTEGGLISYDKFVVDHSRKQSIEINPSFSNGDIISNIIKCKLDKCIEKYNNKYPDMLDSIGSWSCEEHYNFQKYDGKDDGFKKWHCDSGSKSSCSRILVWMFYLNNAQSGTDYMYYSNINAKRGRCIIWPASITHVHRSHLPNKGLKYIVTGWVSFDDRTDNHPLPRIKPKRMGIF